MDRPQLFPLDAASLILSPWKYVLFLGDPTGLAERFYYQCNRNESDYTMVLAALLLDLALLRKVSV